MPWQKFSDRARESLKLRRAGTNAAMLWFAVGNWCSEHKTNGVIAKGFLKDAWRPIGEQFDHESAAASCVREGLFEDQTDSYLVHDFLHYNPSKERADERAKKNRERQERYRTKKKSKATRYKTRDETRTNGVTQDGEVTLPSIGAAASVSANAVTNGTPSRPVPSRSEEERESAPDSEPWMRLGKIYKTVFDAEQQGTRFPRPYDDQRIGSSDSRYFSKLYKLVQAEAKRTGVGERVVFESAVTAFLRDEEQRKKGFKLNYFAEDFHIYVDRSVEAAS